MEFCVIAVVKLDINSKMVMFQNFPRIETEEAQIVLNDKMIEFLKSKTFVQMKYDPVENIESSLYEVSTLISPRQVSFNDSVEITQFECPNFAELSRVNKEKLKQQLKNIKIKRLQKEKAQKPGISARKDLHEIWNIPTLKELKHLELDIKDFGCSCSRKGIEIFLAATMERGKLMKNYPYNYIISPSDKIIFPPLSLEPILEEYDYFMEHETCRNISYTFPHIDQIRVAQELLKTRPDVSLAENFISIPLSEILSFNDEE